MFLLAAKNQETIISNMYKQQEELTAHVSRHEQTVIDAAWEREEIVRILTRQEEDVEKSNSEREMLMKVVKENNSHIANSAEERSELFTSISKQKGLMESLKQDVNELYQTVNNEVDGISMGSGGSSGSLGSDKENEDIGYKASLQQQQQGRPPLNTRSQSPLPRAKEEIDKDDPPSIGTFTTINASGSVEMLPATSTLSSNSSDDSDCTEDSSDNDDDALGEISMNVGHVSMDLKNKSMDDVESSVDNLCKEAAALIASIPSPGKNLSQA